MKDDYYADGIRVYRKLWDGPTRNEDCAVVSYERTPEEAKKVAERLNHERIQANARNAEELR